MPIVRALLILLVLMSPALAQNGGRDAKVAREAAQLFQIYVEEVAKKGERPDLNQPEVVALLNNIYDLSALNALPPPQGSDLPWLSDWMEAGNTAAKLFTRFGSRSASQPDLDALKRNMAAYENQYAMAMNFLIRGFARQAVTIKLFQATLTEQQRTPVRERGFTQARTSSVDFILAAICSAIQGSSKPENARLVAAAIRDTGEVWASYFEKQDRARVIEQLVELAKQVPDETARAELAAFSAALRAVNI
jgi:hypothetical protein